jgi:hypothetical protein
VVEAVIGAESDLIGQTAKGLKLNDTYGVNLLGVSRAAIAWPAVWRRCG